MAYTNEYEIFKFQQEEKIETKEVVNDEGEVVEQSTLIQEYCDVSLILKTEVIYDSNVALADNKNNSKIKAGVFLRAKSGKEGGGFTVSFPKGASNSSTTYGNHIQIQNSNRLNEYTYWGGDKTVAAETDKEYLLYEDTSNSLIHNLDGSLNDYEVTVKYHVQITNLLSNGVVEKKEWTAKNFTLKIPVLADRSTKILTANNFTDEENPSFTYSVEKRGISYREESGANVYDSIASLQAALSFDGATVDVAYRDISLDDTSYTFNLTEAERNNLRQKAQGSSTVPIYYLTKTVRQNSYGSAEFVFKSKRNFTVVGAMPTLNPTVKDIKLETLALTGDENTFIRYESMAEYAINATASKNATIVSQSVQCGSKIISNLPQGVIDDVESGTFIFNVSDSRNMGASSSVFKNLIEYVKPTCYQKVEIQISGETGAAVKVTISGNYFNGSFGAANNTLKLEVRHTDDNGDMGAWTTLTGTPTFNGTTYELEATFTGFNYGKAYVFQSRATDKLNFVESSQYTIRMMPVFDWSETDFNFNVPVNIEAEGLNLHGETIIRHSDSTKNTVLSATGGNVYIRPKGTNTVGGEVIIYSNGDAAFNGGIFTGGPIETMDSITIGEYTLNDFVIETGEEAMGSNGTWYWRKWASGKSEAWGCRNFGNAAVTTAWGNLYRSAIFTQDLPKKVFIRTPDSININIVHSNYGGWICKHEQTAPSATTTGSFIFVRPASATVSPTNIGFHIVGEWV